MTDTKLIVRRVTVTDGVDIPLTIITTPSDVTAIISARLVVVSVSQNGVTYDIYITYNDGNGTPTTARYAIKSRQFSVGVDIDDDPIVDGVTTHGDIHKRDSTNGRVTTNILAVAAIAS